LHVHGLDLRRDGGAPWQLARYPIEAQREVWADDHSTLICSTYMPAAKVTVVEGGYRISGRWSFSSGSEHCQWILLGGILPPDGDYAAEHGTFLLPRSDYQIERNWDVLGLRGTGSHDIVVEDAFVPAHRVQRTNNWTLEATPDAWSIPIRSMRFPLPRCSPVRCRPRPSAPCRCDQRVPRKRRQTHRQTRRPHR
jgi:hypothetical protein